MDMVNCPKCGRLFTKIKNQLCPACQKEDDEAFQAIRKFAEENENCTIGDLSQGTGVSEKRILRYIREGRLEVTSGMRGDVRCKMCNRPIAKGIYCDSCFIEINQNISKALSKSKGVKHDGIMHIAEKAHK